MEIRLSKACGQCTNGDKINRLEALEAAAEHAGSLVTPGRVECPGLRHWRAYDGLAMQNHVRCRIEVTMPDVSDEALAKEIAAAQPLPYIGPDFNAA